MRYVIIALVVSLISLFLYPVLLDLGRQLGLIFGKVWNKAEAEDPTPQRSLGYKSLHDEHVKMKADYQKFAFDSGRTLGAAYKLSAGYKAALESIAGQDATDPIHRAIAIAEDALDVDDKETEVPVQEPVSGPGTRTGKKSS
jgi:hypothetical protein